MTSWKAIESELMKCVLLCARCHREVHDGWHPRYLTGEERGRDEYEDYEDSADLDFPALLEEGGCEPVLAVVPVLVVAAGAGGGLHGTEDADHVAGPEAPLDEVYVGRHVARLDVRDERDGSFDPGSEAGMAGGPATGETHDDREVRGEVAGRGAHGGTREIHRGDQTDFDDFLEIMRLG